MNPPGFSDWIHSPEANFRAPRLRRGSPQKVTAAAIAAARFRGNWVRRLTGQVRSGGGVRLSVQGCPRCHDNVCRGRRPRRPLFGFRCNSPKTTALARPNACAHVRDTPQSLRQVTHPLPQRYSAGAVRDSFAKSRLPPVGERRPSRGVSTTGAAYPNVRGETSADTDGTREEALKAASLVTFLPRQESDRPPRRRPAGNFCQEKVLLTNTAPRGAQQQAPVRRENVA
jgi:hypothetical protein